MATEDERYRQTSQFRLWSFSPSHLASLREKTNALAQTHISARLRASDPPVDPLPDFLTPAEEQTLLAFYTVELLKAAAYLDLPADIQATAAIFFRRFYVTNSIMTYPPPKLLKTCIFFGCKAEGYYFRLQKFAAKLPNTTGEEVLAAEYVLCQGIRFAFDVKHPHRSLEGIIMELRAKGDFDDNRLNRAHGKTRAILKFSPLVTDAYFLYTPSQIMFAALAIVDEELVQHVLGAAFAGQEAGAEKVWNVIQNCAEMLRREPPERYENYWGQPVNTADIKPLNKKLKKCRDPDRVDLVALQQAKREQAQQKPKEAPGAGAQDDGAVFGGPVNNERDSKRRKVDDPFGPPL